MVLDCLCLFICCCFSICFVFVFYWVFCWFFWCFFFGGVVWGQGVADAFYKTHFITNWHGISYNNTLMSKLK